MKYNVNFTFNEVLQAAHPKLEITLTYNGRASVCILKNGIEIENCIKDVWVNTICDLNGTQLAIPKAGEHISQNEMQFLTSGEMGRFLGKCREAARKAYYKERMKEAARNTQDGIDEARKDAAEFPRERPDLSRPIMRQEFSEI